MHKLTSQKTRAIVRGVAITAVTLLMTSCAQVPQVIPNHQDKVGESVKSLLSDDPTAALTQLEQKETAQNFKPDILFLLEKGELSFINNKYEAARLF